MPKVVVGAFQSPGGCDYQEDRYVALAPYEGDAAFVAVYDGHSGPKAANYCSKHFHVDLAQHATFGTDLPAALRETAVEVDQRFLTKLADGGCTASMAVVRGSRVVVANAGDSRCVLGTRAGEGVALSSDHKPDVPTERARIEAAGHTVEMQSVLENGKRIKIARVDGIVACSRGFGDVDFKDIGMEPQDQAVSCVPEVTERDLDAQRDWFLVLASDGLWDVASSEEAARFVSQRLPASECATAADAVRAARELVEWAIGERGSLDNTTAVVAVFNWVDTVAQPAPPVGDAAAPEPAEQVAEPTVPEQPAEQVAEPAVPKPVEPAAVKVMEPAPKVVEPAIMAEPEILAEAQKLTQPPEQQVKPAPQEPSEPSEIPVATVAATAEQKLVQSIGQEPAKSAEEPHAVSILPQTMDLQSTLRHRGMAGASAEARPLLAEDEESKGKKNTSACPCCSLL